MNIKIIRIPSETNESPSVNWIGPDSELDAFKLLPQGKVPDMILIHYDQQHYNLVISKESMLFKNGTLAEQFEECLH